MFAIFRLVAGRRILVLVVLAALMAAGIPAVREQATRLLACGVNLHAGHLFGGSGATVVQAVSGGRITPGSPQRCLREAMRTSAAARTWMQRRSRAQ